MSKITKYYSKTEWTGLLVLFGMISSGLIIGNSQRQRNTDNFLISNDTLAVSYSDKYAHNQSLIDVIVQSITVNIQYYSSRESDRAQARALFATFLAASVVALFTLKQQNIRDRVMLALFALGLLLYGNDVNTVDVNNRTLIVNDQYENSMFTLLSSTPQLSRWYDLDTAKIHKATQDDSRLERMGRKLYRLLSPDLTQDAFFLGPMFLLIILSRIGKNAATG